MSHSFLPVDKELLAGNWHAARDDGSKFRLTLSEEGKFHWKYSVPNQKGDEFSGTYTVDGPVLALERSEGGVLAGTATFDGDRRSTSAWSAARLKTRGWISASKPRRFKEPLHQQFKSAPLQARSAARGPGSFRGISTDDTNHTFPKDSQRF